MKEKMMRLYNNSKNGVQKHSPEILAGVGVVGVGSILICTKVADSHILGVVGVGMTVSGDKPIC